MNATKLAQTALSIAKSAEGFVITNGPSILTGIGIGGMLTTVVVACKETPKAVKLLEEKDLKKPETPKEKFEYGMEVLKTTVPVYWPSVVLWATSASCILLANHIHLKRTATLGAAYFVADGRLKELKDKTKDILGEKKADKAREEILAERLANTPLNKDAIMNTGFGTQLCFDAYHARYFYCSAEKIRRVEIEFEKERIAEWNHQHRLTESGVSELLNLAVPRYSGNLWFGPDNPLEFVMSSMLKDDIPVLVIDYENDPIPDYKLYGMMDI